MIYKDFKRVVGLVLIGLMVVALSGCGVKDGVSNGGDTPPASNGEASSPATNGGDTSPSSSEAAGADESAITDEPELAPPLSLKDMSGKTISLEDYKGSYVLINFWATWCQYCDEEMPDLVAFQKKHKNEVTVLAVNVNEDAKTVQAYLDKKNIDLKVLLDQEGKTAEDFLVSAFPTTFLIDRAGKVIGFIPGKMSAEDMEASFNYLKERDTVK